MTHSYVENKSLLNCQISRKSFADIFNNKKKNSSSGETRRLSWHRLSLVRPAVSEKRTIETCRRHDGTSGPCLTTKALPWECRAPLGGCYTALYIFTSTLSNWGSNNLYASRRRIKTVVYMSLLVHWLCIRRSRRAESSSVGEVKTAKFITKNREQA